MEQVGLDRSDHEDFCYICGFTVPKEDVACNINGEFIDWHEKARGKISIDLCTECYEKLWSNVAGGFEGARRRSSIFDREVNR